MMKILHSSSLLYSRHWLFPLTDPRDTGRIV
jgi:hypothetical protein